MSNKKVYIYKMSEGSLKLLRKKSENNQQFYIANISWLILELVFVAQYLVSKNACLGEIFWKNIKITDRGVERKPVVSWVEKIIETVLRKFHNKFLHDEGCKKLGVSKRVLKRIIKAKVHPRSQELLLEGIDEAFLEWNQSENSLALKDLIVLHLETRLTPVKPRD